jgi:hypothetical protein
MNTMDNNLAILNRLNPHLADEVKKLPEIRKFRNDSSRLALGNLLKIYQLAPDGFERVFKTMDEVGIPAHRQYCSALQALFWIIQDEKMRISGMLLGLNIEKRIDKKGNSRPCLVSEPESPNEKIDSEKLDHKYTLESILDMAWNDESLLMQRSTIRQIINRIQTQSDAEEYAYLLKRHDDLQIQSYIMDDYLKKRTIFDANDWHQIKTAIDQSRWKVFYTVADRLNAPELVSYYISKCFSFRKAPANGVYFTFFDKKAQCTDAAYFAQFMLKRAGYQTFIRSVKWDHDPWDGLHTGAGIVLEDGRFLLVSSYTGINSMSGPFSSLESLDNKLSCGRKIIGRKWGAYYPPRYY